MLGQRFCQFCGAPRPDEQARFCGSCGRSFVSEPQVAAPQPAAVLAGARKRPLWMVFIMTAGTFSVYFFVHLGLMWAEMKRALQDPTMNPVAHALAQFVPFYGWFRFHAQVRTLDEMLSNAGSSHSVPAGMATVVYIVIGFFSLVAGSSTTPTWLIFPSFAAYGVFAAWRQDALNKYYDQVSQGTIPERIHGFEWVIVILGVILLGLAAIGAFLPPA